MFELKAKNCCALLRDILDSGPDGGACPPGNGLPCRGFTGNCADVTAQFSDVPVLPDFPDGLSDWECHSFPDEANSRDSFLVGLISIAAALPVTLFIFTCFDLANDADPPPSFLHWPLAWPMLIWGFSAHHSWHYSGPSGQPRRFVRWFIRFRDKPVTE